jgi:hypothetical protein
MTVLLALLLFAASAHAAVEERRELKWEFPAPGITGFVAKAMVGSIRIETDRKSGISIRAVRTVRAKDKNQLQVTLKDTPVQCQNDNGTIILDDVIPEHLRTERFTEDAPEVELELEVHLPSNLKLSTSLAVGPTQINGECNSLTIKSGYGLVKLENLRVRSGAVITLDTGDLEVSGTVNDLQGTTKVGSIKASLEASAANRVALQTQVGSITSQFKSIPKLSLSVATSVGSVQLKVPGNFKGDATVSVQTGKPRTDFSLTRRPRSVGDTGGLLTGTVGKGPGTNIKLSTGVGDAALERG